MYMTKLAPKLNLRSNKTFVLLILLYGLFDSGDLWHTSLDNHMRNDLRIKLMITDQVLYIKFNGNVELIGMIGSHGYDLPCARICTS